MSLKDQTTPFLKHLEKFDYTLSGSDPTWELLFQNHKQKWVYLLITKYQKTYYINRIDGEGGSIEVTPGKKKIPAPTGFSDYRNVYDEQEQEKTWLPLIIAARKWLKQVEKNWIKTNKMVQEEFPLKYRYGTVPHSLIRDTFPNSFRLDKQLGKRKARQFIRLVENNYFMGYECGIVQTMTAKDFFDYCKIAYLAAADKKRQVDDSLSGKALYKIYADGRHEGLLDIDPNSESEFSDWLDGTHPKRDRGGHPWEIKRGGNTTHIGLRVTRPSWSSKEKFKIELYGGSSIRLVESIKMFLAIYEAGLPITINDATGIRKRLLGQDHIGIVPNYDSLHRANQQFSEEDAVYDVLYFDDLGRYKRRIVPFIRWAALPILKVRT